jgi:hypothetical protein
LFKETLADETSQVGERDVDRGLVGGQAEVLVQIADAAHLPGVVVERGHDALVDGGGLRLIPRRPGLSARSWTATALCLLRPLMSAEDSSDNPDNPDAAATRNGLDALSSQAAASHGALGHLAQLDVVLL